MLDNLPRLVMLEALEYDRIIRGPGRASNPRPLFKGPEPWVLVREHVGFWVEESVRC